MSRNMKIVQETGSHFDLDEDAARDLLSDLLSRPLFAHLDTASDQAPRESPVWFLWESGALWIIGKYRTDTFPKSIDQEPRCEIGLVYFNNYYCVVQHV